MVRTLFLCALAASAGCSFGDDRSMGGGGDAGPDGKPDGMVQEKDHILLSEIKIAGGTTEFIEIWNPTSRTIDLSNYYLSDVGDYWKYPSISNRPTVPISDFIVRFPDKATIAPKGVITVAFDSIPFKDSYGFDATYSLDVTSGTQSFRDRTVPGGVGQVSLTDNGEIVVLFYWDSMSDLVKDVDIALAGSSSDPGNGLKTKESVDGPDADSAGSSYQPENGLLGGGMNDFPSGVNTFKRRTLETGSETQNGMGNGITGDDETSEALKSTWDGDGGNFTAATPGTVPAI